MICLREKPIGVFDSGVGGLTVVSEVMKALPDEDIVYFGDTARVPYGSKSKETVTKYSKQITSFLVSCGVKAIIIACNTASSNSYDELVRAFSLPIIEVVRPGVKLCLSIPNARNIGVIGTEMTIKSGAYEKFLKAARPDINVFSKACPIFVPLAEEGWTYNEVSRMTARIYLGDFKDKNIDALILGCTHYPLLEKCIQEVMPQSEIVNPAKAAACEMKKFLSENNMLNISDTSCENQKRRKPSYSFYVSDDTKKFNDVCTNVLGRRYNAKIIDIESF